jgi:phosphoenolpyruvate carboxykinase (ATP)
MKIAHTRAMINAALSGALANVDYRRHPVFNLEMPASCPGVPSDVLDPRSTWADKTAYDAQAKKLAGMFTANFKTFEAQVDPTVVAAGPKA